MHRIAVAFVALALMAPLPASAYHHRMHSGRSVATSAPPGGRPAYGGGYNQYANGPDCRRYGYPPNCAYWELPDWNGGWRRSNPGAGP
jgi:hypothetical protein